MTRITLLSSVDYLTPMHLMERRAHRGEDLPSAERSRSLCSDGHAAEWTVETLLEWDGNEG